MRPNDRKTEYMYNTGTGGYLFMNLSGDMNMVMCMCIYLCVNKCALVSAVSVAALVHCVCVPAHMFALV